jgi:hypothetical protein
MLEFFLYLVSGLGYGLYFDLNPLETVLVAIVLLCAFRGVFARWTPDDRSLTVTAQNRRIRAARLSKRYRQSPQIAPREQPKE